MANVKSRLKAPKSASTKKKKTGLSKVKKSSAGTKGSELKNDNFVMRRPSNRKVLTADEKVKFLLKNGHKLKEMFMAKPPVNVKPPMPVQTPNVSQKSSLPVLTKSGHLKKKSKCNMKLIDSILKNELMISDRGAKNKDDATAAVLPSPLPAGVNNNNDTAITDQNNTFHDFSDEGSECKVSDNESATSNEISDEEDCSDKNDKADPKGKSAKHIKLKNGVVLSLANFECDYCKKTFNKKGSIRLHMYAHLGIKQFRCPHCRRGFKRRINLHKHIDNNHKSLAEDPEIFICNYCDKPFLDKETLKEHLATHGESENPFKCIYCNKVFSYHTLLIHHEKKHMVRGRHECTLCSMSYRCRNRLYMHVKSHLKIKDFVCQYCGKEFLRQNSLTRHVEVSHGGHRIVCPICKKNLKGHLTEHMRTHEKKRPHVCPECGQRFTQSTQMNVHRRSHTGARPYPCRICKRLFSHSNALMLHIRRHTGEKPFPCAMCPMSFSQLPHMKTHMRKIHGKENPYKCAQCNSFYKLKAQLDVHEKTCSAGTANKPEPKGKKKKSKGDDEIEVEASMSLSRMRFLLALLLTMIATKEKLKYLGFNKRLVDEILIESLEAMSQTPCKDESLPPVNRLRKNIEMLLVGTVPKDQMENFKKENKSTEDILELLTNEKDK
uniref:C2H2-type domain-containing protein n=2 Tax=Heliothis virescens TaxID=7102 RepID=A0A2A4J9H2_HELVI